MPRVLQVVLSLNAGGTERLVIEIVKRLHSERPMAVCCLDEPGVWATELDEVGISVSGLARRPGFRPGLSQAVADHVRRHRAAVVHAHHYSPFVYAALARAWVPRARVVFTEHGRLSDHAPSRKRRLANAVLSHLAAATFTVSQDLRTHLIGEGFPAHAVDVIYNGIDVGARPDPSQRAARREMLGVSSETFLIGTIARLDPVKNLDTLIRAAADVAARRPAALLIVGDGPERASLESAARSCRVPSAIRFLGHRDDAREWLAACDVFANSSISEGISLTILEAMAAGLPVVATQVGGTPEIIDDTCGRLVPARAVDPLAAGLLELASSDALRQALGRAARTRAERRFTLDRMVDAYRAVYDRLG